VESALHNCFTFLRVRDGHAVKQVVRKSRAGHWGGKHGAMRQAKAWLADCPPGLEALQGESAKHVADAMCLVMQECKCEDAKACEIKCELDRGAVIDLTGGE
jgi:hypothetical protein